MAEPFTEAQEARLRQIVREEIAAAANGLGEPPALKGYRYVTFHPLSTKGSVRRKLIPDPTQQSTPPNPERGDETHA